jgi:MFS family permease
MRKKVITKTILLVSLVSLFTDIASEMLYPVMPVFLRSIGFSVLLIGILEGVAEATAGFSKGFFGKLSDVKGKRLPFVQWGYFLSAISKPLMAIFTYPLWIFFSRTMDRLGKGIRTGARDAILSDETTKEDKAKVFGFHRSLDTVGAAIGPIAALVFLYFYPGQYRWLFILAFIPGLVAIFITFLIKEKNKPINSGKKATGFFSFVHYWKKAGRAYKLVVIGLLLFPLFNSSDAFLLLTLKNNGLSDTEMIGVYIFYNLIYALISYPIGIIADKIGMRKVIITGFLIFSAVYISFGFVHNIWVFIFLFFLYAVYAASTEGISKAWISNICAKEDTATAIGFYTGFASVFTLLSSSITGLIWFMYNPTTALIFSGAGVFCVAVYFLLIHFQNPSENHRF